MRNYLLRRLLLAVPTLIGITLVTFGVSRLAPGSPLSTRLGLTEGRGRSIPPAEVKKLESLLGLDQPLPVQYLRWLKSAVSLDFGESMSWDREPVRTKLWRHFRVSAVLQILSLMLIYLIAVPIGVLSAVWQGRLGERLVTLLLFLLYSLPNFFLATLLIMFLSSGEYLRIFPMLGLHSLGSEDLPFWASLKDSLWHLVLPVTCLTYAGLASISRYARSGTLEVIRQDYIRTARAKGLSERMVVAKHALRNSIIPVVTLLATLFPYLLGGSVIVETVFGIPGMGLLAFEAVRDRDYPVVMAVSLLVGCSTLLGILVSDVLYVLLDPRISLR